MAAAFDLATNSTEAFEGNRKPGKTCFAHIWARCVLGPY
jgi:hypothetical protein